VRGGNAGRVGELGEGLAEGEAYEERTSRRNLRARLQKAMPNLEPGRLRYNSS